MFSSHWNLSVEKNKTWSLIKPLTWFEVACCWQPWTLLQWASTSATTGFCLQFVGPCKKHLIALPLSSFPDAVDATHGVCRSPVSCDQPRPHPQGPTWRPVTTNTTLRFLGLLLRYGVLMQHVAAPSRPIASPVNHVKHQDASANHNELRHRAGNVKLFRGF